MASEYHLEQEKKHIETYNMYLETLPVIIRQYIRSLQMSTSARTRLEYVKDIRNFCEYICEVHLAAEKTAKDITPDIFGSLDRVFFEDYLDYLSIYRKNGREYQNSRITIRRKLASIRGLYAYMYNLDLISENVTLKVTIPKITKKEIVKLDNSEQKKLVNITENGSPQLSDREKIFADKHSVRNTAIVTLLLSTGIRISELVGLDIDDVDIEKCCLRVTRKGGKEDIVFFSDEAAEYLITYLDHRKIETTVDGHEKALFLSSQKRRITDRAVENMIKKQAKIAAPLKNITPHKLRSTYATNLYEATSDIYLVAESLGHSNVNTTKEYYAKLSEGRKEAARNKLPNLTE